MRRNKAETAVQGSSFAKSLAIFLTHRHTQAHIDRDREEKGESEREREEKTEKKQDIQR